MENVTYQTSGALNRSHFALVSKQEHALSPQEADKATWECFNSIKKRMTRPSDGIASSFSGLITGARGWGLNIPINSGWDSRQVREDLLLLLYCRDSLNESGGRMSASELRFALPSALTLAEAGLTIEERRAGYLFCTQVLPRNHEMQLLLINTVRKDLDSTSVGRITIALNAIIATPNADVVPAVITRLEELLSHRSSQIRRRALHAFRLLGPFEPEILQKCLERLPLRLKDPDIDVRLAALPLLELCFENGYIERKDFLNVLLEFVKSSKWRKESKTNAGSSLLAVRALRTLQDIITQDNVDLSEVTSMLLKLSTRATVQHSWSLLLAAMKTLARLPIDAVMEQLFRAKDEDKSSRHPLFFLRALLRSKDPNVTLVLLQSLAVLPVEAWAGGDVTMSNQLLAGEGEKLAALAPISDPSPSNIDETDLFGEDVSNEAPKTELDEPNEPVRVVEAVASFPPLFEEAEVGVIVGYLKSDDLSVRKLTIQILARTDQSRTGLIGQYLSSLLDAANQMVIAGTIVDENQRSQLVTQALEVAEVTAGSEGKAYAATVMEILLHVDREAGRYTPASPTPSSRSNLSTGTSRSARGRGGVVDGAVEMILTRARSDSVFFKTFSEALLTAFVNERKGEDSVTLLVICAATACELAEIQLDLCQRLLDCFSSFLLSTSLSIQETLILSMLRLVAIEGVATEGAAAIVRDLRQRGGRHMQNRCLQFLDQTADLAKWRTMVQASQPLNISSILNALEKSRVSAQPARNIQNESPTPSQEQRSPSSDGIIAQKQLRYSAYENPGAKEPIRSNKSRDLRANLFRDKISQTQVRRGYVDASDLIELTSTVNINKVDPRKDGPDPTKELSIDDSPFEDTGFSTLPDITAPPFLSRTKSPPISPRLSGSGILRSPPLSPRTNITPRGSPSSRLSQLPALEDKQDVQVTFDIRWDRLGVLAGTTTRGWFEGEASQIPKQLKSVAGLLVTAVYNDGAEMRLEVQHTSHKGLMKLRQEEDSSTLWLLRSDNKSLQGMIKEALL